MALYRNPFFHGLTRKYISIFGQLFDSLYVMRYDESGVEVERERVPIYYGNKEKWSAITTQDPNFSKIIAIKVPRLAFEFTGYSLDTFRSQNNNLQHMKKVSGSNSEAFSYFSTPVPYDLSFTLHVIVKAQDDLHQIIEQIAPAFHPDIVLRTTIIDKMNYKMDIPINLQNIQIDDTFIGAPTENRFVTATLSFVVKGWLVGPVRDAKPIKKIILDYKEFNGNRLSSTGIAPYADGRDSIMDVLSTDDYEFLKICRYFDDVNDVAPALDDAFDARKP